MSLPVPCPGLEDIEYYMLGISQLPGFDKVAKLSSNESPLGMSPRARAAARHAVGESHRYPEVDADVLRNTIANYFGLESQRITVGPGSDELLFRIVNCFAMPGDEVMHSEHAYMQFPIYAKTAGATPVAAPDDDFRHCVDSLLARVSERTRVVIIANPDNPSGTYLTGAQIRRLRRDLPEHMLLIIDAAYEEYALVDDYESGTALVHETSNVIVTRTFSKVFGMAGLRLGWCYASPDVVDLLERIGPSFPANVVANAAAVAAIEDDAHTQRVLAHNSKWNSWFCDRLKAMGLQPYPSQTNFVLVRFPDTVGGAAQGADAYLQQHGIIARRFMVDGFEDKLRFTIGLPQEMKKAAQVLEDYLL